MRVSKTQYQHRTLYATLVMLSTTCSKMGQDVAAMYLVKANGMADYNDQVWHINKAIEELGEAPSWLACHVTRWTYQVLKAKW